MFFCFVSLGSSEREVGVRKEHIASLYDSLAAELRERLNNRNSCPILLPPKDYDTVSRRQGRLDGIDTRRSTNYSLVGLTKTVTPSPLIHQNSKSPSKNNQDSTSAKSSGGKSSNKSSSGIGSDEALSSAIQEVSSHPDFGSKEIDPDTSSDDEEDWPDTSGLNDEDDDDEDEDEVVPSYEWRRPPRFAPVAPAAVPPQPRDRRSRSSPDEEDDPIFGRVHRGVRGIVDKFERRAVSPTPVSQEPPSHHNRTPVKMAANARRSDPYADHPYRGEEPDPQDHLKQQHFEVVYRRHSNPLEKKIQRESRPVSYPAAVIDPVSPRLGKSRPGLEPHMDHRPKYKELPRTNFVERESRSPQQDIMVDHHNPVQRYPGNYDRYSPSHPRDRDLERPRIGELEFYRDSRPMSSSPVRQFRSPDRQSSPHNMYPRQRQASATDIRQAERAFPSRFVEPYPSSRPTYHPPPNEERRRSGYFDLPVDPRDYRHSFVESPFRRLPLNTQY